MSSPSDLILSSEIIRETEVEVDRQRELIDRMAKKGQPVDDAARALMLMKAAVEAMRLLHLVAVAAARPITPRDLH